MKQKKAQGHVEIILSFVIFIGFLLFVFTFMNPFAKTKEPAYIMDNVQKAIINNISSEIGKLSVIGPSGAGTYIIPAEYGSNFVEIQETFSDPIKCNIYFSDEVFSAGIQTCLFDSYNLGTYSQENIVVYEKIQELKLNYENNYNDLKLSLAIINDFSFSVKDFAGAEFSGLTPVSKPIPGGVDVQAREIPIRIINSNADILELILNMRVW